MLINILQPTEQNKKRKADIHPNRRNGDRYKCPLVDQVATVFAANLASSATG